MNGFDGAERTINGTFGEMWMNNEQVGECYGLSAKVSVTREDVLIPGRLMTGNKVKSMKGSGSMKLWKTTSRMAILLSDALKAGKDIRCTIVSKLADPDAFGAERVAIKQVSFDDLILAAWENGSIQKDDVPFTFEDWEFLDTIGVQ